MRASTVNRAVVEHALLAARQIRGRHEEAHGDARMRSKSREAVISSRSGAGSKSELISLRAKRVSHPGRKPAKKHRRAQRVDALALDRAPHRL